MLYIHFKAKYKPQSKDDLHMRSIIRDLGDGITPIDQGGLLFLECE